MISRKLPQRSLEYYGYPKNIQRKMGKGGYGEVFATIGEDPENPGEKKFYAVKVINRLNYSFLAEVNSMLSIPPNPYTMHPIDICLDLQEIPANKQEIYIILPLGTRNLLEYIAVGIPPEKIDRYIHQMCNGLAISMQYGIWIRDVKPENFIYYEDTDTLVLSDFGLSICNGCSMPERQYPKAFTINFRPPENILRPYSYEISGDIWSLGCSIYEVLTGDVLFPVDEKKDEVALLEEQIRLIGLPLSETYRQNALTLEQMFPGKYPNLRIFTSRTFEKTGKYQPLLLDMLKLEPRERIKYWQLTAACPILEQQAQSFPVEEWSCCSSMLANDEYIFSDPGEPSGDSPGETTRGSPQHIAPFPSRLIILKNIHDLVLRYQCDEGIYYLAVYVFDKYYSLRIPNLIEEDLRNLYEVSCFYIAILFYADSAQEKFKEDLLAGRIFSGEDAYVTLEAVQVMHRYILYELGFFLNVTSHWNLVHYDIFHLLKAVQKHNPECDIDALKVKLTYETEILLRTLSTTNIFFFYRPSQIARVVFEIVLSNALKILYGYYLRSFSPCSGGKLSWMYPILSNNDLGLIGIEDERLFQLILTSLPQMITLIESLPNNKTYLIFARKEIINTVTMDVKVLYPKLFSI